MYRWQEETKGIKSVILYLFFYSGKIDDLSKVRESEKELGNK